MLILFFLFLSNLSNDQHRIRLATVSGRIFTLCLRPQPSCTPSTEGNKVRFPKEAQRRTATTTRHRFSMLKSQRAQYLGMFPLILKQSLIEIVTRGTIIPIRNRGNIPTNDKGLRGISAMHGGNASATRCELQQQVLKEPQKKLQLRITP